MTNSVKNSLLFTGLSIAIALISNYYIKNNKFHYYEELIYFSQQEVRQEINQANIAVFTTGDLELDSLNYYLKFIRTKKPIFINIPIEDLKTKFDNMIGIYSLMDSISYTFYGNLFFSSDNSLSKHFLPKNRYGDSMSLISYSGNVGSFFSGQLNDLGDNAQLENFDAILVGYCGKSFSPFLDKDSTEVWNTPKGLMYDTILKANIITQLDNNNLTRILKGSEVLFYAFMNFLVLFITFRLFVKNKYRYAKFKAIQLIHLLLLVALSINVKELLFPLGLGITITLFIGELIYWLDKSPIISRST